MSFPQMRFGVGCRFPVFGYWNARICQRQEFLLPKVIENVNEFLFGVNAQFRVNVARIAFHGVFG